MQSHPERSEGSPSVSSLGFGVAKGATRHYLLPPNEAPLRAAPPRVDFARRVSRELADAGARGALHGGVRGEGRLVQRGGVRARLPLPARSPRRARAAR